MANSNYLTRIEVGEGAVARSLTLIAELGAKQPLIVTDRSLVVTGLLKRLLCLFSDFLSSGRTKRS